VISPTDLDMLATAADLIAAQLGGSPYVETDTDLELLHKECEGWASLIAVSDEIADDNFRQVLLAQLNHLIWLIDNAINFGLPRVVQRGDQVAGSLVRAVAYQRVIKNTSETRNRIIKFIATLTTIASLIHSSQTIFDAADHALPGAEKIINELTSGNQDGG
jgi:hypothetical protein